MTKNGKIGPIRPEISKIRLLRFNLVSPKFLKLFVNLSYIILQMRMQYENFITYHIGANAHEVRLVQPKGAQK